MGVRERTGLLRALSGRLTDRIGVGKCPGLAAVAIGKGIRAAIPPGALKDALSGAWLGHALHPALTDVVLGSFLSATLLDLLGGDADGRGGLAESREIAAAGFVAVQHEYRGLGQRER